MSQHLRLGLLLDSLNIPSWQNELILRLQRLDFVSIELVVVNNSAHANESIASRFTKEWSSVPGKFFRHVAWYLYNLGDVRRSGWRDPFTIISCSHLLRNTTIYGVTPIQSKYSDRFSDTDIENLRLYKIDVFVRLGFRILRGDILRLAAYGVWSYHHGNYKINRGGPAGFWEVFNRWPETGSTLQILTETLDGGLILYRSISSTDCSSYIRNRANLYWKTLSFIPRKLEQLSYQGADQFFKLVKRENADLELYSGPIFKSPTSFQVLKLLSRTILQEITKRIARQLQFDQWVLLISMSENIELRLNAYHRITPPSDRFWADPHVIKRHGCFYIFFEEYFYSTRKGRISCLEIDRKGDIGKPFPVLENDYHLSYPFIFSWNDRFYMIPESRANKTIELYECDEFPNSWKYSKTLMSNVEAVDSTLVSHLGKWWLFTNLVENSGASSNDELFLFYADSPLSNCWMPHPLNPIISDANFARPAGAIFVYNGRLIRPSQICVPHYGYGLSLNEITEITETTYSEKAITHAIPNWSNDVKGIHSFGHTSGLTVCDALIRRKRYRTKSGSNYGI